MTGRGEIHGMRRGGSTRAGTQGSSIGCGPRPASSRGVSTRRCRSRVVAAGEKACRNAGDPLDAEVAELLRVALIVVRREAGEVVSEHMLQGVGAPLGIDRPR